MEIELKDPRTLNIKVYEKGMLGYLYIPAISENAYFDKDGFVVETSSDVISNVPKVTVGRAKRKVWVWLERCFLTE